MDNKKYSDYIKEDFYKAGSFFGKIIKPFNIYAATLIFVLIYLPIYSGTEKAFMGYQFIWDKYNYGDKIYTEFLLIEILTVTLIFFAYLFSKGKK